MDPQVSVVLPVYNSERYLAAAVASILQQTFADFEVLAIDGGSSDRSLDILREFASRDPRVRVVKQEGKGLVGALNQGLAMARGEFLARMDADDIAHPERFARQVAFLRKNTAIAVVGSAMTLIDGDGRRVRDIDYPVEPAAVARALEDGSALAHPAVMMRRETVVRTGGYRPVLDFAEDYDLWLRMSEQAQLANLPDRLLSYRHHAGKRGSIFAFEQELHTQFARLSAAARRNGRGDPLDRLTDLSVDDLGRFGLSAEERERLVLRLVDPLLGATSAEEMRRAVEVLDLVGPQPLDRRRVARKKHALALMFYRGGRYGAALLWSVRAAATSPGEISLMWAALGVRMVRKAASATRQQLTRLVRA